MGSKSSNAPAPDPALIAAQIKSMGIQDSAIQQMLDNSGALLPLQKEQMSFGLDASKTAYGQSQEDRTWALGRRDNLTGVQDTMVKDANQFSAQAKEDELAGKAEADVNAGFANVEGQQSRALSRTGVNPSSGKSLAISNQTSIAKAAALAGADTGARTSARLEGRALTDRASNALAGYPAMGMTATGSGATIGTAGTGLTNAALTGMNSGQVAAGGLAGNLGANATGMYGAQASYKNAQDQIAASNDPAATIGGAVGGMAMAYATGGLSVLGTAAAKKYSGG